MPYGFELLVIGVIVLVLFGAQKLPELAKSLGQSKTAFQEGLKEGPSSEEDEDKDDED
jgi:sec-independent protein translocase protein TatA